MQRIPQTQARERTHAPSMASPRRTRPRAQAVCSCSSSNHPGSFRCSRHKPAIPNETLRRSRSDKEILRRALSPRSRQSSQRWWNFRPTPSRLRNMSLA
ncbi:hypothetical protein PVL29_025433 [Vitis rotundifolia]|uniref:Uncharacterized protein n=1 Tax=Vitis rotundifolia TaxID=103349 RepID=A0AA38YJP8_VITRO|nr:hypothetical protein PVL29_025433 [Vitis rotundifolia]